MNNYPLTRRNFEQALMPWQEQQQPVFSKNSVRRMRPSMSPGLPMFFQTRPRYQPQPLSGYRKRRNPERYKSFRYKSSEYDTSQGVFFKDKPSTSTFKNFVTPTWNKQDAEKALKVELEASRKRDANTLLIRFPDPKISVDMIKSFNDKIEKVFFHVPIETRYCFVQIADNANVDEIINDLNRVDFYDLGKLKAEKKIGKREEETVTADMIDPYTLFVGNLPLKATIDEIKKRFPTAVRCTTGFSPRLKHTRYAFVGYQTVEESIEAFRLNYNSLFDSRTLIVRFRRMKEEELLRMRISKTEKKSLRRARSKNLNEMEKLKELREFNELNEKMKRAKKAGGGGGGGGGSGVGEDKTDETDESESISDHFEPDYGTLNEADDINDEDDDDDDDDDDDEDEELFKL